MPRLGWQHRHTSHVHSPRARLHRQRDEALIRVLYLPRGTEGGEGEEGMPCGTDGGEEVQEAKRGAVQWLARSDVALPQASLHQPLRLRLLIELAFRQQTEKVREGRTRGETWGDCAPG